MPVNTRPNISTYSSNYLQTLKGHIGYINSVTFSHNDKTIASGSNDSTIRLCSVTFSHNNQIIASGSNDNTIQLWLANTGIHLQTLEGHTSSTIASGSYDSTIRLWLADTGKHLYTLKGHTNWVNSVAFSHNGNTIVSGSNDSTIRLWSVDIGIHSQTLEGHTGWIIASGSNDNTVRLWDAATGKHLHKLEGHTSWTIASGSDDSTVGSVAFSYDSKTIASGSGNHVTPKSHTNWTIALGSSDGIVQLWSADTGEHLKTLNGHTDLVSLVTFSHDSNTIASGSNDDTTLEGHFGPIRSVTFSRNGRMIALGSYDSTIRLWDAHTSYIDSITFLCDDKIIVSDSYGQTERLWDVVTGDCHRFIKLGFDTSFDFDDQCLLRALPDRYQERCLGYSISADCHWITFNGKDFLWLPAEYRPGQSAVFRSTIAIGTNTGRIIIMRGRGSTSGGEGFLFAGYELTEGRSIGQTKREVKRPNGRR
ncbi:WD40-repeat-containing domain protein [Xylaria arbuscula]|nr:WD40-repeat-containing domain protein [Xylaria arbuscula]